jgi:hypothetical protein
LKGGIAGALAGFFSWFVAAILLFVAYGADGQAPLAAFGLGLLGAGINIVPGCVLVFAQPRAKGAPGTEDRSRESVRIS